jgi:hypothetical protein|tara:strand:+ start:495 stop:749 length:255 start_codon:yes stop_codon:yes gene_type:complete
MLIEGLSNITFVNGILRVQCTSIDPSGKEVETGTLEIPGGNVAAILNGLINSSKAIEEKLNGLQDESNGEKKEISGDKKKKKKK